jgi:predicted ester cyclase
MKDHQAPRRQKDLVRVFYHEMWNRADKGWIPELTHADVTFRSSLGLELKGHAALAEHVDQVTVALGDYTCEIVDMVEEGEKVVARLLFHGRHRGIFMGFQPTGQRVEWAGSAHFRFRHGKIADLWVLGDLHGLIRQLQAAAGVSSAPIRR